MYAFSLNMVIATIWLLLSQQPSVAVFTLGFLMGYGIVAVFRQLLPDGPMYIRRSLSFLRFLASFMRQFLQSNLSVAAMVLLHSNRDLHPNLINYDTSGLKPGEILVLSYCITLTPGTVTIRVSDDYATLVIHALDAKDPEAIRQQINLEIRDRILAFTR